jgi:hypothetical protein
MIDMNRLSELTEGPGSALQEARQYADGLGQQGWEMVNFTLQSHESDDRSRALRDRWRQYGWADLVYRGERSHVIEYLSSARLAGDHGDHPGVVRRQRVHVPRRRGDGRVRRGQLRLGDHEVKGTTVTRARASSAGYEEIP